MLSRLGGNINKNINPMESVLWRVAKMIDGLYEIPHEDRVLACGLLSIDMKRRLNLFEGFRMVSLHSFFQ